MPLQPFGLSNITQVTMDNLTAFNNATTYSEFAVRANWQIYGGWLYFILLWTLAIILYMKLNDRENQPLVNAMYSLAAVSIISLFVRAVKVSIDGTLLSLLQDKHLWVFPILTIVIATIIWATKDR